MKKLGAILIIFIITSILFLNYPLDNSAVVHYHAGFTVYVDGVKQDFSDFRFMNFTACSEHDQKKTPEDEQIELAHLHDGVGDVVHVHRQGAVWGDLFQNINFDFPTNISLTGLRNGQAVDDILQKPIEADESIVIIAGDPAQINQSQIVSLEHIKKVEAQSELCGDN